MSLRDAGALIDVSHQWVSDARKWLRAGGNVEALPDVQSGTLAGIRAYLAIEDQVTTRRAALRMAAERLTQVADELRREAAEPDAGAIPRVARVGRSAARRRRG